MMRDGVARAERRDRKRRRPMPMHGKAFVRIAERMDARRAQEVRR